MDFKSIVDLVLRRKFAALLALQLGIAYMIFQTVTTEPSYVSTANLLVKPSYISGDATQGEVPDYDGGTPENETRVIEGSTIRLRVAQKLGYYPSRLFTNPVTNTNFITILYYDADPKKAQVTAQAVAEEYRLYRLESVTARLERTIKLLEDRIPALQKRIAKFDAEIAALSPNSPERDSKALLRSSVLNTVTYYNQRIGALSVSVALATGGVTIIEPAFLPSEPIAQSLVKLAITGIAISVAVAVLLIALLETFDDRIRNSEDVQALGIAPLLGVIPNVRSWRSRKIPALFTQTTHSENAGEAYRALLVATVHALDESRSGTVQFTSPHAKAGKTTTVANLGALLGWSGRSAVAVDLDLRSPKASAMLGFAGVDGFSEVVVGEATLWDSIQQTALGTLRLVPSGSSHGDPSETIGRTETRDVLRDLESQFDVVLVDSGALMPYSDALVMVPATKSVILVVREGKTHKRELIEAADALRSSGGNVIGLVLTASHSVRTQRIRSIPKPPSQQLGPKPHELKSDEVDLLPARSR